MPISTLLLLIAAAAFVGAVYGAASLLAVARRPQRVQPFGSGLPPREHAVSRFHVRWYTVAMVFLAFDMEMVFMYPWTLVVASVGATAVIEMFVFLAVLLAGALYAWREGAFRWT